MCKKLSLRLIKVWFSVTITGISLWRTGLCQRQTKHIKYKGNLMNRLNGLFYKADIRGSSLSLSSVTCDSFFSLSVARSMTTQSIWVLSYSINVDKLQELPSSWLPQAANAWAQSPVSFSFLHGIKRTKEPWSSLFFIAKAPRFQKMNETLHKLSLIILIIREWEQNNPMQ